MRVCYALIFLSLICGSCSYINKKLGLKDDHILEEKIEDLIESQLDLEENSIDLTPFR